RKNKRRISKTSRSHRHAKVEPIRESRSPAALGTTTCGGSAWESNPPRPASGPTCGFEDRDGHQAASTPLLHDDDAVGPRRADFADVYGAVDGGKIVRQARCRHADQQPARSLRILEQRL